MIIPRRQPVDEAGEYSDEQFRTYVRPSVRVCMYITTLPSLVARNQSSSLVHRTFVHYVIKSVETVRLRTASLSSNDSGQVVHTHVPMSLSSTVRYLPKGGDALWLCS